MPEKPPLAMIEKLTKSEPVQFKHNWLYSVLPIKKKIEFAEEDTLYLAGYCRNCDNGFSVEIPRKRDATYPSTATFIWFEPLVSKLNIPKWGCVDPVSIE